MAVAVLLLAAHMAACAGFLEGAPVERRIELSGVDTIDIGDAQFTVEVLGAPELETVTVVSRMSTRFHRFHDGASAVERSDGAGSVSVRYYGHPLSQAAVTWDRGCSCRCLSARGWQLPPRSATCGSTRCRPPK